MAKTLFGKRIKTITENDPQFAVLNAVSVTFVNIGTNIVTVDELPLMPNGSTSDNLLGDNRIKNTYSIRFGADSGDTSVNLTTGNYLLVYIWEEIP